MSRRIDKIEEDIRMIRGNAGATQQGASVAVQFDDSEIMSKAKKVEARLSADEADTGIKEQNTATEKKRFTKFDRWSFSFATPVISPSMKFYPDRMNLELYSYISGGKTYNYYRTKTEKYHSYGLLWVTPIWAGRAWKRTAFSDPTWDFVKVPLKITCGPVAQVDPVPSPIQTTFISRMLIPYKSASYNSTFATILTVSFIAYLFSSGVSITYGIDFGAIGTDDEIHHFTYKYDVAYAYASAYIATGNPSYPYALGSLSYRPLWSPFVLNDDHYIPETQYTKGPWMDYHFASSVSKKPVIYVSLTPTVIAQGDTVSAPEKIVPGIFYNNSLLNGVAWTGYELLYNTVNNLFPYKLQATLPFGVAPSIFTETRRTDTDDYDLFEVPVYSPIGAGTSRDVHTNKTWQYLTDSFTPGSGCHIAVNYPTAITIKSNIEINQFKRTGGNPVSTAEPFSMVLHTKDHYGWDDMEIFEVARYGLE